MGGETGLSVIVRDGNAVQSTDAHRKTGVWLPAVASVIPPDKRRWGDGSDARCLALRKWACFGGDMRTSEGGKSSSVVAVSPVLHRGADYSD